MVIGCTCPVPFTEDDTLCSACEQFEQDLYAAQAPATCQCCGGASTEGTASLCWECEDEAMERQPGDHGCPVQARFERFIESRARA